MFSVKCCPVLLNEPNFADDAGGHQRSAVCSGAANVAARERAATQSDVADDVSSDVVRWRSWHGAGRQRRRRVALSPSARAAARGGAATAAARGRAATRNDVGAVPAGSVGDVLL